MNDEILTLTDDEGNEIQLEYADLIIHKDEEYAVFFSMEDDGVIIFRVGEDLDDDNVNYEPVEDEKVLNEVFSIFKKRYEE